MKGKICLGLLATALLFGGLAAQEKKSAINPAQLFPSNAVFWFSINDFQGGITGAQKYLETFVGKKKADELFGELKTQIKNQLATAPADDAKVITATIKSLKSLHFGVFNVDSGNYELAAAAEFSDSTAPSDIAALIKPEVHQTTNFQGSIISHIIVGERQNPFKNIFLTTFDNIVLATTSAESMRNSIVRSAGGVSLDNSLLRSPDYQGFASKSQSFKVGGSLDIATTIKEIARVMDRKTRFSFDKVDALLGLLKVESFNTRVYFEDGKISSEGSVRFGSDCTLYNDFLSLEPSSAKDTLKLLPSDSFISGVYIVNDLKKRWYKTERILTEGGLLPKSAAESFQNGLKELKDSLDLDFNKIFDVVDDQMAFYMGMENLNIMMGGANNMQDVAYIFKCKSNDKLLSLLGKLGKSDMVKDVQKDFEKIREHKYGGDVIRYIKKRKGKAGPGEPSVYAFSIVDNYLIFGLSLNTVQKIIDAYRGSDSIANSKEYQEAISKMPEKYNSLCFFNGKILLATIEKLALTMGGNFPNITDSMIGSGLDTFVCVGGNNEISFKTNGIGVFAIFPTAIPLAIGIPSLERMRMPGAMGGKDEETQTEVELVEPFTPPQDKDALDKLINQLVKDLGSNDADKRNTATDKLKLIGRPAIGAVKSALSSQDPEIKLRARNILLYLKEYGLFPDELSRKVKTLLESIKDMTNQEYSYIKNMRYWQDPDGDNQLEPISNYPTNYYIGSVRKNLDFSVLESDAGVKEFSKALLSERHTDIARYMIAILTQYNASAASDVLLKICDTTSDREIKCLALAALGWSDDPKAKEKIAKALKSDKAGDRRAAFLAIERSTDTAFMDQLVALLESPDDETRFNAGYTLAKLTSNSIAFNAFASKDILTASVDSARQWWSAHKADFVINKRTKITNPFSAFSSF